MNAALQTIPSILQDFSQAFGTELGMIDAYRMDHAEVAIVVLSSTAGTAKAVVDDLRDSGIAAGLIRPRVIRPFPAREIVDLLTHKKAAAVLDRSEAFSGQGGPLFTEIRSALYGATMEGPRIPVINYIYGLGGRDVYPSMIEEIYQELASLAESGQTRDPVQYLGVRE